MFMRMTKVLLTLGLLTAAGSSSAFYIVGGNMIYSRYCAQVWSGGSGTGVMEASMAMCQQKLQAAINQTSPITGVETCHVCVQKFDSFLVPLDDSGTATTPTAHLPRETVQRFLDGSQELRERFRIDDYERAQRELQRSVKPEPVR